MTTVIETCRVEPPQGTVAEQSLPLSFFDMTWIHFHPMFQLFFFDLPPSTSKPHFLDVIIPKLKRSLSLTLKHFFPLSGKVVYPLSPEELPVFRYRPGDSVPFTISESCDDYDDLVGNHAQSADKFYCLVPRLPPIVEESDHKLFQVLAVQVTFFPGRGMSVGIVTHHCVSDAPSFVGFISRWASISKNGGDDDDEELLIKHDKSLPIFDRSLINYPLKLDSIYWKDALKRPLQSHHLTLPTNRIRTTYFFTQSEIKRLKNLIQEKVPSLVHLSSFVAIAAYIWSTLAKSLESEADVEVENDDAYFLVPIDLRPRLDPPAPQNYSGNCLSYALPRVGRLELAGDEGLFLAAEAMTAEIKKRTGDKKILETVEKWSGEIREAVQKSFFSVAGSTRLDLYGADFGWGKARKQEILSIDGEKYAMTLCMSRDIVGGLEVCLSLPKNKMDAFDAYFSKGIKD